VSNVDCNAGMDNLDKAKIIDQIRIKVDLLTANLFKGGNTNTTNQQKCNDGVESLLVLYQFRSRLSSS
jgi:hypothetical protein